MQTKVIAQSKYTQKFQTQKILWESSVGLYKEIRPMVAQDCAAVLELLKRLEAINGNTSLVGRLLLTLPLLVKQGVDNIYRKYFTHLTWEQQMERYLMDALQDVEHHNNFMRVFYSAGAVQGFSWAGFQDDQWLIHDIIVNPQSENKKIATALVYDLLFLLQNKQPARIGIHIAHPAVRNIILNTGLFTQGHNLFWWYGKEGYWFWDE